MLLFAPRKCLGTDELLIRGYFVLETHQMCIHTTRKPTVTFTFAHTVDFFFSKTVLIIYIIMLYSRAYKEYS